MKEFSQEIIECIAQWGKRSADCNGDVKCLEACSRDLRSCLDAAIPDSGKIEFERDKVNYIMSSIFFLANRISKATIGLAEFDKVVNKTKMTSEAGMERAQNTELKELLNEIIAKYF
jgi:uncharacterized protein YjhX (UPF0386 family)